MPASQPWIASLSTEHQKYLAWFADRVGTKTALPRELADGSRLACAPKGIYKPKGWEHALSVRINLGSKYDDGEVTERDDGSWFFQYRHEEEKKKKGDTPQIRDRAYTNRALMACIDDHVPVGVLIELPPKKEPAEYKVLGLAVAVAWQEGYFFFESVPGPGGPRGDTVTDVLIADAEAEAEQDAPTGPLTRDYDARRRVLREIVARRGQSAFRTNLLRAYNSTCAITGCTAEAVLEAAPLIPHRGPDSNTVHNGLLLRADVHTLLDLGLLAVDPETRCIAVSKELSGTEYATLDGRRLTEPADTTQRPARNALMNPWQRFQDAEKLR